MLLRTALKLIRPPRTGNKQLLYYSTRLCSVKELVPIENAKELISQPADSVPPTPSVLDECTEDVSDYALHLAPSFNFAAYADRSPLLQEFVKLGVDLSQVEKIEGAQEFVLRLDFDRDVKPRIQFLHDHGVPADQLGNFVTKNPFIFKEELENLQIRINYLEAKLFPRQSISRIITKNPKWLSQSTNEIDHRLGFVQSLFSLVGQEVRHVAVRMPTLITYRLRSIEVARFGVLEEMGFTEDDSKVLLLNKPKVYTIRREDAVARFAFAHNEMGLAHNLILDQPDILVHRLSRIRHRHLFLASLNKAQYDPLIPGYVSMKALLSGSDAQFSTEVAKSSILVYNKFLKTL